MSVPLLSVRGLRTTFATPAGDVDIVDGVDLDVQAGEMLGLVGESGSGKSMTLRSILRLVRPPGRVSGAVLWRGHDLLALPEAKMRGIRGREIGMIFQEPTTALNPVSTVGRQILENLEEHGDMGRTARRRRAIELLDLVGIPAAARRLDDYPHQFSGGMRQRAMIAIALASSPALLLADEPTTALDVTIQDQILKLLLRLRETLGMAVILVTHDLGVVAQSCERVAVMYAGRVAEIGTVPTVFAAPAHAYTLGLLQSVPDAQQARQPLRPIGGAPPRPGSAGETCPFVPRCGFATAACGEGRPPLLELTSGHFSACVHWAEVERAKATPQPAAALEHPAHAHPLHGRGEAALLVVEQLSKTFPLRRSLVDALRGTPRPRVHALSQVDLAVRRGETLGIVGESGCGKSTLARCLVRLQPVDSGSIDFDGFDVVRLHGSGLRAYNRRAQMVFQDPYGSLNPRMTVRAILSEALSVHRMRPRREIEGRIAELMDIVRLPREAADRRPHEFSGGQRQRIGIARALALEPDCLIADELVSALDVSVQAQMVNLLLELQQRLHLTVLFIAHDLRLVRHLSHRVAVMYLGRVVELAETEALFTRPRHPYAKALLAAAPEVDPARRNTVEAVHGELPSPVNPPPGCPFHPRCPEVIAVCRTVRPPLAPLLDGRLAACHVAAMEDERAVAA